MTDRDPAPALPPQPTAPGPTGTGTWEQAIAPGMRNLWFGGYNFVRAGFPGKPLFAPSWSLQKYILVRTPSSTLGAFLYPDHVAYDESRTAASFFLESTIEYQSDYEGTFGFDVSGGSKLEFASLSADSGLTYRGSLFSDSSKLSEIAFFICRVGGFQLSDVPPLPRGSCRT